MVDDQILKAASALVAVVDQQLSLLDAEIAASQRRIAELESIISAPAPLSFAELFFVESMLTPTLKEAEVKAAGLPVMIVESDDEESAIADSTSDEPTEASLAPALSVRLPALRQPDAVDDTPETRPEDLDLERKLLVAYE